MKQLLLKIKLSGFFAVMFSFFVTTTTAQSSTANYTVTNSATASLIDMAGSAQLIGPNVDDGASFIENMVFNFWFMGVRYNNFSASSNGAIRLGINIISATEYGTDFPLNASDGPIIAPFFGDFRTSGTGKVHSIVTGTAPNRKCVIEFLNMGVNRGSTSADATFQIVLNETSGIIQFIYGSINVGSTAGNTGDRRVVIGFCSDDANNKTLSVDHSTFASSTSSNAIRINYNNTGVVSSLNSAVNGLRKQITFTPPVRTAPTAPVLSASTTNTINANWVDLVTGELGFVIYKSEDAGNNYIFALQTNANTSAATIADLLANKNYIFKIHSISEGALSTPVFFTGAGNTSACMSSSTNTLNLTGAGPYKWSEITAYWNTGQLPKACNDAVINVNRSAGGDEQITLVIDVDVAVKSLTINNLSTSASVKVLNISGFGRLSVTGNLTLTCYGGNKFNRCDFSTQNKNIINGNVILGRPNAAQGVNEGQCGIGSNGYSREQLYIIRGDVFFNKRSYTTHEYSNFTFDKAGTQYLYNYTTPQPFPYVQGVGDTLQPVQFEKLIIGDVSATTLIFGGTSFDGYIKNLSNEGVTIGENATLDLSQNYSLNSLGGVPYFKMLNGSKLRLAGDKTINPNGTIYGVPGSNFPGGFSSYTLDANSTIEYYGTNAITQTIYNGVTYANLVANNGSGAGRAQKISTGPITVNSSFNINALTDVTLGALGSTTQTVNSTGTLNVAATGGLYCNANVVSGTGNYTMGSGSFLGIGHPMGISTTGSSTGNIQMTGSRSYNVTANYIYNGVVGQITGTGLPALGVNDLTTDNPTTVTITNNQTVNGTALLKQGVLNIGSTKITINGSGILNSTGGKMKANFGMVEMKGTSGTAQTVSGNWFVNKTISSLINGNSKGITVAPAPADTLLIASALVYGTVSNSQIITNDNLTLLSRDTATARFGSMVSGNSITGKVTIERYLPAIKSWRLLAAPVANATSPTVTNAWREGGGSLLSTGYGTRITGPSSFVGVDEYTQRASMKYYDGLINNYVDVTNTNSAVIGNNAGYYVFVRGDRSVAVNDAAKPTILRIKGDVITGNRLINIPAGKFISFGNPYPSKIDFRSLGKSNIANSFIVWNPNSAGSYNVGAFETYTLSAGEYRKVPGGAIRNTIESGEAVFIQSNGAAGSLTITETDKASGISTPVSRAITTEGRIGVTTAMLEINMYTKDVDGSNYLADGILINFDDSFSTAVDNDDVRKISNTSNNLFLKNGAANLVVESRPLLKVTDTIRLSLTGTRINPYRFEIDPSVLNTVGLEAILKDKFLGTETSVSLTAITNYNFIITADAASRVVDRFMIVFKQVAPTRFTKINAVRNADNTATVHWYTENENNINTYSIEHSRDGINFTAIGSQTPTANNFGNPYYSFIHATPVDENNWYRIKANSINSAVQYSNNAKISELQKKGMPNLSVYPNPVENGNVHVRFTNYPTGNYQLMIYNTAGQLIAQEKVSFQTNNYLKTITIPATAGTYQLKIMDEYGKTTSISFFVN